VPLDVGRVRNLAGLALAWLARQTAVSSPPIQIFIETTNLCNYRCSYCVYKLPEYQDLPKGKMGTADFRRIMERVREGAPAAEGVRP
jgi:2-iminoacetate synthase ThiH